MVRDDEDEEEDDHEALARPVLDANNGNVTDFEEFTEDEEQPRKMRKLQRGDMRELIQTHQKAMMGVENKEGACCIAITFLP
jgi:hypothetical protein